MATTALSILPDLSLTSLNDHLATKDCPFLTQRSRQRGYKFFVQGYVHGVKLFKHAQDVIVRAKCYRSMRKSATPHKLLVELKQENGLVSHANCSCTAGLSGRCSHIVGLFQALMHYQSWGMKEVPADMSCTQLQQLWGKARGAKIKPERVQHLVLAKAKVDNQPRKRRAIKSVPMQDRVIPIEAQTITRLREYKDTPLAYLLTPDTPLEETPLGSVQAGSSLPDQIDENQEMIHAPRTILHCGNTDFPCSHTGVQIPPDCVDCNTVLPLTAEEAIQLEKNTVKQADSEVWFEARKGRLTASNFHRVVKRKKDVNSKFVSSVMNPSKFYSISTNYGTANENVAKEQYCQKKPWLHVHDCGLVVNPACSFLGATPDGKVCIEGVTGLLEIKCPYSARNKTISQAVEEVNDFCLEQTNDEIRLKPCHDYMYQIQGQLMITGAPFCEFVVYTKSDMHIERIVPNVEFQENMMEKLTRFYKTYGMPFIQAQKDSVNSQI